MYLPWLRTRQTAHWRKIHSESVKIFWSNLSRILMSNFYFFSPLPLYPIVNLINVLHKNTILKGKIKMFFQENIHTKLLNLIITPPFFPSWYYLLIESIQLWKFSVNAKYFLWKQSLSKDTVYSIFELLHSVLLAGICTVPQLFSKQAR